MSIRAFMQQLQSDLLIWQQLQCETKSCVFKQCCDKNEYVEGSFFIYPFFIYLLCAIFHVCVGGEPYHT